LQADLEVIELLSSGSRKPLLVLDSEGDDRVEVRLHLRAVDVEVRIERDLGEAQPPVHPATSRRSTSFRLRSGTPIRRQRARYPETRNDSSTLTPTEEASPTAISGTPRRRRTLIIASTTAGCVIIAVSGVPGSDDVRLQEGAPGPAEGGSEAPARLEDLLDLRDVVASASPK